MKYLILVLSVLTVFSCAQQEASLQMKEPEKPWVFWYWMEASVSKEGITADLEAMKEAGIGGAYLMPIKGPANPPLFEPVVEQLTPIWWEMVRHSMSEAKRLGLQIGMHASDGFALAGGPWITPELSMQKVVWSETQLEGNQKFEGRLILPPINEGYYKDIAVFAINNNLTPQDTYSTKPNVRTSTDADASFLVKKGNREQFRCEEDCWFQYSFEEDFTVQSIRVITKGNNYQSHRLLVEASRDGINFEPVYQMEPARHGWQDTDEEYTYAIPKTTARYFRFQWKKGGTEPGAEDLDAAKWSPRLKIIGLEMSNQPKIHHYEAKNGSVWRIAPRTKENQLNQESIITQSNFIDITDKMDSTGFLTWGAPEGNWTILRMGHTSTGHTNYTGGGGLGLECDKFNPAAVNVQFDGWFGTILDSLGADLTDETLNYFHVDSWECGSQNWSPVFQSEFEKRRGYDLVTYLPIMAGVLLVSTEFSEKFLFDIRQTITELVSDNFYQTFSARAKEKGMLFSAESIAPTMMSDGLRHHGIVDLPMGEFWLNSPTHDKPNDMLDAISGAHIYGKQIIQAEGFTELRMSWDEHPGMLRTLLDRNYALGINKLFFHVYMQNPWMDRQPGMSLGGVGLFFQRDQTWWKPGAEFVTYVSRCQELLQEGWPVTDVAVYSGEGLPSRSALPDRLVSTLPGIFGKERVEQERIRLLNEGQPQRVIPKGVKHSANMADPEDWLDPLNGYRYDSFNKHALINLAKTEDGKVQLGEGTNYQILVLPQARKMNPNPEYMSVESLEKLTQLVKNGATLLINERPKTTPGLDSLDQRINGLADEIWGGTFKEENTESGSYLVKFLGKGQVIKTPFQMSTFEELGVSPDFIARNSNGNQEKQVAWTHRKSEKRDIYFVSNQSDEPKTFDASFRIAGKEAKIYDPVTDQTFAARQWKTENGRTELSLRLEGTQSLFVIFEKETTATEKNEGNNWDSFEPVQTIPGSWEVTFHDSLQISQEPIIFDSLVSWTEFDDPSIQYYSGSATYEKTFRFDGAPENTWISVGRIENIAEVTLNGKRCGVSWTKPGYLDISDALIQGKNVLSVAVTNTWKNRMIGDHEPRVENPRTWTNATYRLEGDALAPAGLLGPVGVMKKN